MANDYYAKSPILMVQYSLAVLGTAYPSKKRLKTPLDIEQAKAKGLVLAGQFFVVHWPIMEKLP